MLRALAPAHFVSQLARTTLRLQSVGEGQLVGHRSVLAGLIPLVLLVACTASEAEAPAATNRAEETSNAHDDEEVEQESEEDVSEDLEAKQDEGDAGPASIYDYVNYMHVREAARLACALYAQGDSLEAEFIIVRFFRDNSDTYGIDTVANVVHRECPDVVSEPPDIDVGATLALPSPPQDESAGSGQAGGEASSSDSCPTDLCVDGVAVQMGDGACRTTSGSSFSWSGVVLNMNPHAVSVVIEVGLVDSEGVRIGDGLATVSAVRPDEQAQFETVGRVLREGGSSCNILDIRVYHR